MGFPSNRQQEDRFRRHVWRNLTVTVLAFVAVTGIRALLLPDGLTESQLGYVVAGSAFLAIAAVQLLDIEDYRLPSEGAALVLIALSVPFAVLAFALGWLALYNVSFLLLERRGGFNAKRVAEEDEGATFPSALGVHWLVPMQAAGWGPTGQIVVLSSLTVVGLIIRRIKPRDSRTVSPVAR